MTLWGTVNDGGQTNRRTLKCGFDSERMVDGAYINGRHASRRFCSAEFSMCCDTEKGINTPDTPNNPADRYAGIC